MALLERLMPKVGDVLRDRYELREVIGEGGFGVVFRARQRGLDADVAVKVLLPHLVAHESLVRRFEREVTVVKTLRHPNTIRVLDVGQTEEEIPFYVMEYVTGRSLEKLLEEGPLAAGRARRIALQLLKSLAEAHERGVVHRDLKPANVMLCEVFGESDFVKVLDFGIAKAIEDDQGGFVTQTGAILGTPTYLSPEQARGERDLDPRSDLYSVGLILAECLCGEPLVSGGSTYEVVATHAQPGPLHLPRALRHSPFAPILERALAKVRAERFQTAMEMAEAIATLAGLSDDTIFEVVTSGSHGWRTPRPAARRTTPEVTTPATVLPLAEPRRPKALLWLLAVATIGLAAALAFSYGFDGSVAPPPTPGQATLSREAPPAGEPRERRPLAEEVSVGAPDAAANGAGAEAGDAVAAPLAVVVAEVAEPLPSPLPSSEVSAERLREAVERAVAGVERSLPAPRPLRLEGTEGARVLLGERELGRLPLDLSLPRLAATLDLRFERRGFETRSVPVSLGQDVVRVELARRRAVPADPGEGHPAETPPVPTLPFEEAPIYD
jgi:eukaryotic-like serine/threonine-protein kinase